MALVVLLPSRLPVKPITNNKCPEILLVFLRVIDFSLQEKTHKEGGGRTSADSHVAIFLPNSQLQRRSCRKKKIKTIKNIGNYACLRLLG